MIAPAFDASVDAVIVGGGPAGMAAALTLLRYTDCSVLVVERDRYDRFRVGETVPPGIRDILVYLGAEHVLDGHLPAPATAAAWGGPEMVTRDFLFTGRGNGWHLDRRRFDAELADMVTDAGGTVTTGAAVGAIGRTADGWEIGIVGVADTRSVRTRMLVDATGRRATIARRLGGRRLATDALLGVTQVVRTSGVDDPSTLVESTPEGWWYTAPIPGGRMVAALMTDAATVRRHRLTRSLLTHGGYDPDGPTAARLAGAVPEGEVVVRSAASCRLDRAAGQGWIAVGDAAAAFDPLASMGIGYALTSGAAGIRALHAATAGDDGEVIMYTRSVASQFDAYLDLRRAHYAAETRWPNSAFWRRRQTPTVTGQGR